MDFIKKHFIKKLWFWLVIILLVLATYSIRSGMVGDMLIEKGVGSESRKSGVGGYGIYEE